MLKELVQSFCFDQTQASCKKAVYNHEEKMSFWTVRQQSVSVLYNHENILRFYFLYAKWN